MNTDRHRWVCVVLLLFVPFSLAPADGKYFGVADTNPMTPFQRGLVAHKDGIETLIVESTLNAPAGDYSWVIPIPSKTISIEPVGPGALETAVRLLTPRVSNVERAFSVMCALLWLAVVFMTFKALSTGYSSRTYVVGVLLMLVGMALAFMFFPVFAGGSKGSTPGTFVREYGDIGSYSVSEVHSKDKDALANELRSRGAAISGPAELVIKEYVAKGWSFVVARLRKAGGKLTAPHPLKIRFAVDRPIYPMKLTGVDAGPLRLQLIVIGSKRATAKGLAPWRSVRSSEQERYEFEGWNVPENRIRPVGHPAIAPLVMGGQMLTLLVGDIHPSDMSDDLQIGWLDDEEFAATLHTSESRNAVVLNTGLILWALTIFAVTTYGIAVRRRRAWVLNWGVGAGLLLAGLASFVYGSKIEVVEAKWGSRTWLLSRVKQIQTAVDMAAMEWDGKTLPKEWLQPYFKAIFKERAQFPEERDVPGGYGISKEGSDWVVSVYDEVGAARRKRFTRVAGSE